MHSDHDAWRAERRQRFFRHLPWLLPVGLIAGAALVYGFGQLFVWLWRQTIVDIFGVKPISFWQAWGLILLAQFLFKANMRPTARTGRWRGRWHRDREGSGAGEPERA